MNRITVEQGYLSVLRSREGRLRVVPSLSENKAKVAWKSDSTAPAVAIGTIELRDSVLEFFDATVRRPAHKLRLERLQASVEGLQVPELSGRTKIQLEGVVKGVQRQAALAVLKNRNDQIRMQFTLEGNLNDPQFSLNESFAGRVGSGIAETLGVSFEGLARGVGEATRGVGDTVRRLFGK